MPAGAAAAIQDTVGELSKSADTRVFPPDAFLMFGAMDTKPVSPDSIGNLGRIVGKPEVIFAANSFGGQVANGCELAELSETNAPPLRQNLTKALRA